MASAQPVIGIVVTLVIAIMMTTLLIRMLLGQPRPRPIRVRTKD